MFAQSLTNPAEQAELELEKTRISKLTSSEGGTRGFTALLHTAKDEQDFAPVLEHLKALNPAAADVDIRSLSFDGREMVTFVQALTWLMQQRRDFELVQAWMAVFLRVHGDIVIADEALRDTVEHWAVALREEKRRVQRMAQFCGGIVGYLRAARV